jgi:4-alpha-glucanotransferase
MQSHEELLNELSGLCGIVHEYWDVFGLRHEASPETRKAILRAMKMKIDSVEDLQAEIRKLRGRPWNNFMEPVKVISVQEQPFALPVYVPVPEGMENSLSLCWSLEDEQGERVDFIVPPAAVTVEDQAWIDGVRYIKTLLRDTVVRDIGYYSVKVICEHPEAVFPGGQRSLHKSSRLIITPDQCYMPPELQEGRTWGPVVNLYAVRSCRNWGGGDFTDLEDLIKLTAGLGGGFVGINPLHAVPNKGPFGISPYSPISRSYKNFIYLDMERVTDLAESHEAQALMSSAMFKKSLAETRDGEFIDYKKIAFLKKSVLALAFGQFYEKHYLMDSERGRAFRLYTRQEGTDLDTFALFLTLWEHMNTTCKVYTWRDWPEEYLDQQSGAVREFRENNSREVLFHKYIQWLIDTQHRAASELAKGLCMPVGIYHDLAIGSIGGGSNTWTCQDLIAGSIDVGAPPDEFNINGQNWGFPPMAPERLRETGYEFFVEIIRKNMKYNGALRIDHALGMFRLFWIPCGMPSAEGVYVKYPAEDMLRIIALESIRSRTMVIAEDLGTVGENVRDTLLRLRMLSYRLLYFERNYPDPSFTAPEAYPSIALCAVTTHDLPTLYGYWTGHDLDVKNRLHLFRDEKLRQRYVNDRERDKALLLNALKLRGILPRDFPADPALAPVMTAELCTAIYNYLALTPCKLVAVSLDDIIGTVDQQNMPGTTDEHPNWIRKTPVYLEELSSDRSFAAIAGMFRMNKR